MAEAIDRSNHPSPPPPPHPIPSHLPRSNPVEIRYRPADDITDKKTQ